MDSYLYKTTKKEHEVYLKYIEEYNELTKELSKYEAELKAKYGDDLFSKSRDEITAIITPEELNHTVELIRKTTYSGYTGDEDTRTELMYWRKAYGIHSFICRHFLKDGQSDNCERIILEKENIKEIIDELKRCKKNFKDMSEDCVFGSHDYWDKEDLDSNIKFFQKVYNTEFNDDDSIIYYYSWY